MNQAIMREIPGTNLQCVLTAMEDIITQYKQWKVPDDISEEIRTDFNTSHDDPQRETVRDMVTQLLKKMEISDQSKLELIVSKILDAVKTKNELSVEWTDQLKSSFDGLKARKVFIFKNTSMTSSLPSFNSGIGGISCTIM